MNRLHEKLRSPNGASILLALLMFFFCAMVSASILAVAASNAGKVRSSHVEQQKELVLSSAIQLVCDQLEKASYTGQYNVYEWEEPGKKLFYCEQVDGAYVGIKLDGADSLAQELNAMFGEKFTGSGYGQATGLRVEPDSRTYQLTVSLPSGLPGYPYPADSDNPKVYEISQEVTVEVELNHETWHIMVTAWLGTDAKPDSGADTMKAELVAQNVPVLNYSPSADLSPVPSPTPSPDSSEVPKPTAPPEVTPSLQQVESALTWKLYWIKKGAT